MKAHTAILAVCVAGIILITGLCAATQAMAAPLSCESLVDAEGSE